MTTDKKIELAINDLLDALRKSLQSQSNRIARIERDVDDRNKRLGVLAFSVNERLSDLKHRMHLLENDNPTNEPKEPNETNETNVKNIVADMVIKGDIRLTMD